MRRRPSMARSASSSSILAMAKPTWMSTQSPTTGGSSSSRPTLMMRRTPATLTLARWSLPATSSATCPGMPRHMSHLLGLGPVLDCFQDELVTAERLEPYGAARRAGGEDLVALGREPARRAAGGHGDDDQLGHGAGGHPAGRGQGEGLLEGLGVHV